MPEVTSISDPVKPWFDALESGGEFVGIRFGHRAPESDKIEWFYLSHAEFDGIGGFVHLLRERGAEIEKLPQITHPGKLSWGAFVRFLPTMLAPRKYLKWRDMEHAVPSDRTVPPAAVAIHVFDETETGKIRRAARNSGVTVNSLLMKYLDRAIRPSLEDPACAIPWMIPVNLRGRVKQPLDTGNHSSYVGIRIYASEGAREVQKHIYAAIDKGQHLAAWKGFAASRKLNIKTRKRLIVANHATSQWTVGGFSNLGAWDPEGAITAPSCLGDWFFAPPVLRFQMIGAGCVTFQGRLTLTLQIHPELTTDIEVASAWVRSWVREIELGLPNRGA